MCNTREIANKYPYSMPAYYLSFQALWFKDIKRDNSDSLCILSLSAKAEIHRLRGCTSFYVYIYTHTHINAYVCVTVCDCVWVCTYECI